MKAKIIIQESLRKELEIDIPEGEDIFEYAREYAEKEYKDGNIVLTADDYIGTIGLIQIHDGALSTGWFPISNK